MLNGGDSGVTLLTMKIKEERVQISKWSNQNLSLKFEFDQDKTRIMFPFTIYRQGR